MSGCGRRLLPSGICPSGQRDDVAEPGGGGELYDAVGAASSVCMGHHYGPEPWCSVPGARPDWLPSYYHKADKEGIGFDRSSKGSDAVSQYPDSLRQIYNDKATCPEIYLLWFHHVLGSIR